MHNITWRITSQKLDPFSELIVSVLINKSIFGWFIELDWWNLHHCKKKSTIQKHNLCIILGLELNLQNISKWSECAILKLCRRAARWKFPLVPMGDLDPRSAHARPSAWTHIDTSRNFRHTCLQSGLQKSSPPP